MGNPVPDIIGRDVMVNFIKGYQISKKGGKLLVDFDTNIVLRRENKYRPTEKIVYDPAADIIAQGYKPCYGYKSDMAYNFIPVYIRFSGFKKCTGYEFGFVDGMGHVVDPSPNNYDRALIGEIYP